MGGKITHGHCIGGIRIPEYYSWEHIKQRCRNKNNKRFMDYGGRGINVCDRWNSFENFLSDMGPKPGPQYSIDRIDNDGNYEPINCKWSTKKEQSRNKRDSVMLCFQGETKNICEWAEIVEISESTIRRRLGAGWSVNKSLSQPLRKRKDKANVAD